MGNESKVTYKVNGTIVDLPEESVGALLKKYPNAEPLKSYIVGTDTVDLPEASVPALLKKYPDARPTFESIPTVKLSKSQIGEQRETTADELTKGVFANRPQEQPFQGMVGSPKEPASIYKVSKPTDLTDPKAISELSAQQERNTTNANKVKEKAQSTAYVLDNIKKKSELPAEETTIDPTITYTFTGATSDSDKKYDQSLLKEGMAYADEKVEREKVANPLMDEYANYLKQTNPDVAKSKLLSLGYSATNNPDDYDSKLGSFFNEAASWKYNTEKDNIKKLSAELATPLKQLEALGDYFKKTQAQYPDGELPKEEYDKYLKAQEEFKRITGDEKFKELAMWVESNDETTQTLKQYPVLFKKSYDEAVAKTAEQIKQDAEYKNMSAFGRGYGVLWRAASKQALNTVSDAVAGALRTGGGNKSAELIKGTLEAVSDNMVLPSYQDQSFVDNFYDYKGYKVYVNDEGKVIDIRDKEGYIIPNQPTYDKLQTEFSNKYSDQPKSTWDIKEKREYRNDLLVGKLAEQAVSMAALVGGAGYLKAAGLGAKTALTLSGYLSSYEGNYQTAIQSGMTEGSLEARTFAGAASVLTGYLENISPNLPILKKKGFMTAFKDSYMKALATKTPKLAVAKAFSDIMVMEPLQEVTQELSQSSADRAIQAATNAVAGRQYFDTSYDMDEDIETAVLTYLTTVPFTALTGGGLKRANSELKRSAIYYGATHYDSAVSKLDELLESGKIDLRNYTSAKKSIEEGKKHLDKLPDTASEETKAELLDLIVHKENLKKQQSLIDSESGIAKYEAAIQKTSAAIEKILGGAGAAEIRADEAKAHEAEIKANRKANEAAKAAERKANYVAPIDETETNPIVESLEVQDRESAVGQPVNYGGIQGVLAKNENGYHVIDADGNLHLIEGGESQATNDEIGLTKGNIKIEPITQPKVENGETTVKVDLPTAGYNFETNTLQLNGREFEVVGVEKDKKGNETFIVLKDKAEGWGVKVNDQNLILEYLIQQELNTPQAIEITPNEITTAATELGITEPQVEVKQGSEQTVEQVQQAAAVSDTKAIESAPNPLTEQKSENKENESNLNEPKAGSVPKKRDYQLTEQEYIDKYVDDSYDIELAKEDYKNIIEKAQSDVVYDGKDYWWQDSDEGIWWKLDKNGEITEEQSDGKPKGKTISSFEYDKSIEQSLSKQESVDKASNEQTLEDKKADIERRRQEELNQKTDAGYSTIALDYLFTGGRDVIQSTDYLLQALVGGFTNAATEINNIRNKYADKLGNIKDDINSDVYNQMVSEIRDIINKNYNNPKATEIFDKILKNATGFTSREGNQISIELDKLNEQNESKINAKYDAELKTLEQSLKEAPSSESIVDKGITEQAKPEATKKSAAPAKPSLAEMKSDVVEKAKEAKESARPTIAERAQDIQRRYDDFLKKNKKHISKGVVKETMSKAEREAGLSLQAEMKQVVDDMANQSAENKAKNKIEAEKINADFQKRQKELQKAYGFTDAEIELESISQKIESEIPLSKSEIDFANKNMFTINGYEYGESGLVKSKKETKSENLTGKEIEPHPEVSTDVKVVADELGLGEVEQIIYDELKDISDSDKIEALDNVIDQQDKKMDNIQEALDDIDNKRDDIDREIDSVNDTEELKPKVKKSLLAKLNKDYKALELEEKTLQAKLDVAKKVKEGLEGYYYRDGEGDLEGINQIIERVNIRLETRKAVKAGTDLFPEDANIPEFISIKKDLKKQTDETTIREFEQRTADEVEKSEPIVENLERKAENASEVGQLEEGIKEADELIQVTAEPTKEDTKPNEDEKGKSNEGEAAKKNLLNETEADAAENAAKPLDEQAQKIRELFKNKGLNLGDSSVSFSKTNHADLQSTIRAEKEPLKRKILQDIDKVLTSLVKVMPNIKVVLHDSQTSFETAVPESVGVSAGAAFKDGAIHLNMENIYGSGKTNFVYHEAVHPVLDALAEQNPVLIDKLYNELGNYEFGAKYKDFGDQYDGVQAKKEAIVEFIADVANGELNITPQRLPKVKQFFVKVLRAIGLNKLADGVTSKKQLVELAASINNSFSNGLSVKGVAKGAQFSKTLSDESVGVVAQAIRAKASEGISYHEAAQYVMDELAAAGIIDPKDPKGKQIVEQAYKVLTGRDFGTGDTKQRGFNKQITDTIPNYTERSYKEMSNKETLEAANDLYNELGAENALTLFMSDNRELHPALMNALGMIIMQRAREYGPGIEADVFLETERILAERGTVMGQANQVFSLWKEISPEGAKAYAAKLNRKALQDKAGDKPKDAKAAVQKAVDNAIDQTAAAVQGEPVKVNTKETVSATYGKDNKNVSRNRYNELKGKLKAKFGGKTQFSILSQNQPTDSDILELSMFHLEAGGQSFEDFSDHMVKDLGVGIRPYLKQYYNEAAKELNVTPQTEAQVDAVISRIYAEEVAARVVSKAKDTTEKKDPIKILINTLLQKVTAKGNHTKTVTDIEKIRDAVLNKDEYAGVWKRSKQIVLDKINKMNISAAEKSVMVQKLTDYFTELIGEPFSRRLVSAEVGRAIQGVNLRKVLKSYYGIRKETRQSIKDYIISQTGLPPHMAQELGQAIEEEYDARLKKELDKVMDSLKKNLEKSIAKKTEVKERKNQTDALYKEITELVNLGAFTDDDFLKLYAKKNGWKSPTKAQLDKLGDLANEVQKQKQYGTKISENKAVEDLLAYQKELSGLRWHEIPMAIWYANVLSGHNTQIINTVSNLLRIATEMGVGAAKNPKNLIYMPIGFMKGLGIGVTEAIETWKTGYSPIRGKVEVPAVLERKITGPYKYPAWVLKYVRRAMVAADVLMFEGASEMRAYQLARQKLKTYGEGDYSALNQSDFKKVQDILGYDATTVEKAEEYASEHAEKGTRLWKRLKTSYIHSQRDTEITRDAGEFGRQVTYNYPPEGMLGMAANLINQWTNRYPAFKLVVPFTNIIANVANEYLNYTPVGLARAIRGGYITPKKYHNRTMTKDEIVDLYVKAIGGMVLMTTLAMLSSGDDSFIEITANGYNDYQKNKNLPDFHPYSFRIKGKDTWIPYRYSPLYFVFAPIGHFHDANKYMVDKDLESEWSKVAAMMQRSISGFFDSTFLSSVNTMMSTLFGGERGEGGDMLEKFMRNTVTTATSFVVPNEIYQGSQLIADVASVPQKELGDKWYARLLSTMPFAMDNLNNKVDMLGFYINDYAPRLIRNFDDMPGKELQFLELMSKNKTAIRQETFRQFNGHGILDENGVSHEITNQQYHDYMVVRGRKMYYWVQDNFDALSEMDEEHFRAEFSSALSKATIAAKQTIGHIPKQSEIDELDAILNPLGSIGIPTSRNMGIKTTARDLLSSRLIDIDTSPVDQSVIDEWVKENLIEVEKD